MFDSLLDTGGSDNFVDEKVAKSLGFKSRGGTSIVSIASGKLNAPIVGKISGNLQIQRRNYFDVVLETLYRFLTFARTIRYKQAQRNYFQMNGAQEGLVIQKPVRCGVATSVAKSHRLFNNLDPNVKPIATKNRQLNETDQSFIKEEVYKNLVGGREF